MIISKARCDEILNKYKNIFPFPVEEVVRDIGFKLEYFKPNNAETSDISGMINYKKGLILINANDSFYRRRFTVCHEIGHILNGDYKGQTEEDEIEIDYRRNISGENSDPKEIKANQVAAELLMPRAEFSRKFKQLKKAGRLITAIKINLSSYFQVSEESVGYRIDFLKLS